MATKIKLGNGNWGVKDGGTLAYNDENGVFKAIELASSRASGGTYVAQSGLIADAEVGVPRIDWTNGVGELLLEPQSTNLITYSEDFSNAAWVKNSATITSNSVLSPDGSVNADLIEIISGGARFVSQNISVTSGLTYVLSCFMKNGNTGWNALGAFSGVSDFATGTFDLENGVVGSTSVSVGAVNTELSIENYGNGWFRCIMKFTATSTASWSIRVYSSVQSATDYSGVVGENTYIFGAQFEQLSYATSYIRTSGSSVTRIADAVTGNSSLGQVINSSEGVLYAEMSALANDGTQNLLGLNGGSISNSILFGFSSSNGIRFYGAESGTGTGFDLTTAATITSNLKLALRWSLNDVKFYINGTQVGTDTTFAASSSLNELSFDNGSGASPFYGRIRDLKVYDTALTDAELTALTTL